MISLLCVCACVCACVCCGVGWVVTQRRYLQHLSEESNGGEVLPTPLEELKATFCEGCNTSFSSFKWRYHCYFCGNVFCFSCLDEVAPGLSGDKRRRCENCLPDMTHRMSIARVHAGRQVNASSASLVAGHTRGS